MRILYAGAGDIAHRCAATLSAPSVYQLALKRQTVASTDGLDYLRADLTQPDSLRSLPQDLSHILYTATPSQRTPEAYQAVYDDGLQHLLAAINPDALRRFVFVSSTAVYGSSTDWLNEDSPTEAPAFNGQALLAAEQMLRERLGDKLTVVRFTGIYGPNRSRLFRRLKQGGVEVAPPPGDWANRIHIDDVSSACVHLLRHPSPDGLYVASDNTPLPIDTLYSTLAEWLGAPMPTVNPALRAEGKRFRNTRLVESGWTLKWPDTLEGYRAILRDPTS